MLYLTQIRQKNLKEIKLFNTLKFWTVCPDEYTDNFKSNLICLFPPVWAKLKKTLCPRTPCTGFNQDYLFFGCPSLNLYNRCFNLYHMIHGEYTAIIKQVWNIIVPYFFCFYLHYDSFLIDMSTHQIENNLGYIFFCF